MTKYESQEENMNKRLKALLLTSAMTLSMLGSACSAPADQNAAANDDAQPAAQTEASAEARRASAPDRQRRPDECK